VHRRVHYAELTASSRPGSSRGFDLREFRKASRERAVVPGTRLSDSPFAAPSTGCQVGFDDATRGELSSTISAQLLEWTGVSEPFYGRGRLGSRPDVGRSPRQESAALLLEDEKGSAEPQGRGERVGFDYSLVVYKVGEDQTACASVCLAVILSEHPVVSTTEHRSEDSGCTGV
jgi:hypothetical protein